MEAADLLPGDDLAVDFALLDEDRPRPHVPDLDRQQLLRRAQPLEGDHRHHRRRVQVVLSEQVGPDRSTCVGAGHTIARSRRPLGFSTCCTGFAPGTQRQRIACIDSPVSR